MGQEIKQQQFTKKDFEQFQQQLQQQTQLLHDAFTQGLLQSAATPTIGIELESWILDQQGKPTALNERLIQAIGESVAFPELAQFIIEFNSAVFQLQGACLSALHQYLRQLWQHAQQAAATQDSLLTLIGILPSVQQKHLSLDYMSPWHRYRLLNQQLLRLRHGQAFSVQIQGKESLRFQHPNVMPEAMATSMQIHYQLEPASAHHYYNAAQLIAPLMIAVAANSPFLFGKQLWAETRIALFEQAVSTEPDSPSRVTFGKGYLQHSLFELFEENVQQFPLLIPVDLDTQADPLANLNLHNGTIWRWNRPLIGYTGGNTATPHVRIEHRCLPAGPSLVDTIANVALFCGLLAWFGEQQSEWVTRLPFHQLHSSFYQAARYGLQSKLEWFDNKRYSVQELLHDKGLLQAAAQGLAQLGVAEADAAYYLDIIQQRVALGCNGASWLCHYYQKHHPNWARLSLHYAQLQQADLPVHQWPLDR